MAWLPSSGPEKLLAMWTKSDMKYWRRSKRATIWGYFMGKEWHEIQSRNLCNVNVRLLIFILLYDGLGRWANSQDSTSIPINGSSNSVSCKSSNIVPIHAYHIFVLWSGHVVHTNNSKFLIIGIPIIDSSFIILVWIKRFQKFQMVFEQMSPLIR